MDRSSHYLKSKDAAKFLAVHINTLHRWTKEGRIKAYRIGQRGDYRFTIEDLEAFVREGAEWPSVTE